MKMTEPYSPMPRASASANPVSKASMIAGRITQRKTCQGRAPSERAASSTSELRSASTGSKWGRVAVRHLTPGAVEQLLGRSRIDRFQAVNTGKLPSPAGLDRL